ncbi:hypothetical protein QN277_019751 [Acacia crassicarpa]|uniref:Ubiquitin-specific protease family C19-related protein n=1 Tax=Acacia crassicarpa TaxID=499986 RepID=A0AAE1JMZ5_9FABA|nr:hypothetical protein QN277_019751 [Acacia crassicarpa]
MGTRIPSHKLSGGLYVSGPPQLKERQPTMSSCAVPYTGGDVRKSGELGKMFDIPLDDPSLSASSSSKFLHASAAARSGTASGGGATGRRRGSSPMQKKQASSPVALQPTGLITSGPIGSGPIGSSGVGGRRSGPLEQAGSIGKAVYGSAVTNLKDEEVKVEIRASKAVAWFLLVIVAMSVIVGVFVMVTMKKAVVLVATVAVIVLLMLFIIWNLSWKRRGLLRFVKSYPDAELRGAIDGQYVKVTGIVTCGSIPLESSYQRVPRCVYVSTELNEYKGCGGKSANASHRCFSWGSRYSEKYVADFYISDFQSGLRALVKAGNGVKVAPLVKPATVVDVNKQNKELCQNFLGWLADRKLSSDDRIMRLKEGYIKEGTAVSVMGVVRRHDNMLMIVPSTIPVSIDCQWKRCLLPMSVEGLILLCDNRDADAIPV